MRKNLFALTPAAALLANLTACASAPTPATETPATHGDAHAAPAKPEKVAQKDEPSSAPTAEEQDDPRADGLRKASRPPAELITGPNLVYVFNFKRQARKCP